MQEHLDQALHNKNFSACLQDKFPDIFYDWKITAVFYEAIHYLKTLAAHKGIDIGETHYDIFANINPGPGIRRKPAMQISTTAWRCYIGLYNYSKSARYDGMTDPSTFEALKKVDFDDALKMLEIFKKYVCGHGVPIPGVVLTERSGKS